MRISELKNLLSKSIQKRISKEEADYFAQEELEIYLKKPVSEGWLDQIVYEIALGYKLKDKEFKVVEERNGSKLIDCNGLPASLKLKEVHDDLEKRAKKLGIAVTGLFHLGGDDALSLWTSNLAKRDLIGLCFVNGGHPQVVPFGGTEGVFGVNPMSFAIPTLDKPVIGDFATSQLANFRAKVLLKKERQSEQRAVVDEKGEPTKEVKKGFTGDKSRYLPMGANYKGYEIVFLLEVLTGALVRAKMGVLEKSDKFNPNEYGQLIIAIDVNSFTDIMNFKKSVSNMCEAIRLQKSAAFVRNVTVPGDRSYERLEENMKRGKIEVKEELITKLKGLAK